MKKRITLFVILALALWTTACSDGGGSDIPQQDQLSPSPDAASVSHTGSDSLQGEEDSGLVAENADMKDESDTEGLAGNDGSEQGGKILVAYFSRVGNTEWEDGVDAVTSASINVENGEFVGNAQYLAQMAQEVTGGDLFLIETEERYPSDYRETTDAASVEKADDARPALATHVEDMDQYDTIVLIYPNWWGDLPQPLLTFLEEYDFSGKTILPLCTHEGSRMGSSEREIAETCPDAILLDGLDVRGSNASSARSDVETWISDSGILGD